MRTHGGCRIAAGEGYNWRIICSHPLKTFPARKPVENREFIRPMAASPLSLPVVT
jgi:hypothetical protein